MSYFIAGPIARIGQRLPGGTWKKIVTRNAARETVAADGGRLAFDNYETQREDLIPLVVDLDGTLLKSDSLIEGFVSLLSTRPVAALRTLAALRRGKAAFKAAVAREAKIDIVGLPWNEAVLELVRAARAAGRKVYIASASDRSLVEAMARHLGLFDGTFCSDGAVNLSGRAKSRALCAAFGAGGFDYAGNSQIDCAVWECARNVIVVDAPRTLVTKVRRRWPGARVIARQGGGLKTYLRAIRVHQWLKNGLIFVPMLAAKQFGAHELANSALAFLSFSLCASAVYVMNDLIDLSRDRAHATKRTRPFAAGTLPVADGLALAPLLLLGASLLAMPIGLHFLEILGLYGVTNVAYSLVLKRHIIIDVVTLACLYGLRLVAGAAATGIPLSEWMLGFAVFIFASLALVKRCAEIDAKIAAGAGNPPGRGYRLDDLPMLKVMAAVTGIASIVVFMLYLNSQTVARLYAHPHWLALIGVVLVYWIGRILLLMHRGDMDDDPLVFATRDRVSLISMVLVLAVMAAASV